MSTKNLIIIFAAVIIFSFLTATLVGAAQPLALLLIMGGIVCFLITLYSLEAGLVLLIFIIPLVYQITLATVHGATVDVGVDDLMVFFLILGWLGYMAKTKHFPIIPSPLNWPFLAFFSASVISLLPLTMTQGAGQVLVCWLHILKWFEYVLVYFIVLSVINNLEQIKKYITVFFITCGWVAAIQFWQIAGGKEIDGQTGRAMSTFGSEAVLSAYYLFFIPFAIIFYLQSKTIINKWTYGVLSIGMIILMFMCYCRASYLALIPILIALGFATKRYRLFIIGPIFVLLILVLIPPVRERIDFTFVETKPHLRLDDSSQQRFDNWQRGLKDFWAHPFLGVGFWNYRWQTVSLSQREIGWTVHNQYLAILLETGLLGFMMFMWMFYRMYRNCFRLLKNTRQRFPFLHGVSIAYLIALVGLCVQIFFGETLESFQLNGPLWIMTGLIIRANDLVLKEGISLENK